MSKSTNPLPMVLPIWDHDWSDYPDRVKVSMEDGKVIEYRREITQPKPVLMEKLDKFTEICRRW